MYKNLCYNSNTFNPCYSYHYKHGNIFLISPVCKKCNVSDNNDPYVMQLPYLSPQSLMEARREQPLGLHNNEQLFTTFLEWKGHMTMKYWLRRWQTVPVNYELNLISQPALHYRIQFWVIWQPMHGREVMSDENWTSMLGGYIYQDFVPPGYIVDCGCEFFFLLFHGGISSNFTTCPKRS